MNVEPPVVPPQYQPQPPRPRGWWSRNWKWFVPTISVAGLALILGAAYLIITMALSAVSGFTGVMKSTGGYQQAMAKVRADPAVAAAIGTPIKEVGIPSGKVKFYNGSGTSNLTIPISGPKGSATVHLAATKSPGQQWTFTTLTVTINSAGKTGKWIDLLRGNTPDAALDMSNPGGVMFPNKRDSR